MMLLDNIDAAFGSYRGLIRLLLSQAEQIVGGLPETRSIDWAQVNRLVFVCQGNICRSPYAHHLTALAGVPVSSFGLSTKTGLPAYEDALTAAAFRGHDMRAHRTTDLMDFDLQTGDLLIAMEPRHIHRMRRLERLNGYQRTLLGLWTKPSMPHIHDPHRLSAAYFQTCYARIEDATQEIVKTFKTYHGT
jgi:protein-tyrosine phosphatase